jgi:putative oxidoreductase
MSTIAALIGRILLAAIFIESGITKLFHVAVTQQEITAVGLPSGLAIPTGVFELVAGTCLAIGVMTRLASVLLAGFIALTILFFHNDFTDPTQVPIILMHVAMIGGMFMVFSTSQMWRSWDRMRAERRGEITARQAEFEARDAELRAARAEAAADAVRTAPVVTQPIVSQPVVERPVFAGTAIEDDRDIGPGTRRSRWF